MTPPVPRVRKYRTYKGQPLAIVQGSDAPSVTTGRPSGSEEKAPPAAPPIDKDRFREIEAIAREGLDADALREARHMARARGLDFFNDHDAVRALRAAGVAYPPPLRPVRASDQQVGSMPFAPAAGEDGLPNLLPSRSPGRDLMPADPNPLAQDLRQFEEIRKGVATRRDGRTARFIKRMLGFVVAPTAAAGLWFGLLATPIYTSHSEFTVKSGSQTQESSLSQGISGMAGGGMTSDNVMLQDYLISRTAFHQLETSVGFREFFTGSGIDPLTRICPGSDEEQVYKAYKKYVKVAFTPTEGVIRMSVSTPLPGASKEISDKLIEMARHHVDALTQSIRDSQVKYARDAVDTESGQLAKAQAALLAAQTRHDTLSPDLEAKMIEQQISPLMSKLVDEKVKLAMMEENARPNPSQVAVSKSRIATIQGQIDDIRRSMVPSQTNGNSLAQASADIETAKSEVKTHQQILAKLTDQLIQARQQAASTSRYVAVAVAPMRPAAPVGPRPLRDTAIAFLVILLAYAAASLTISLFKEEIQR